MNRMTSLSSLALLLCATLAQAGQLKLSGPADVAFEGKAVGVKLVGKTQDLALKDDGKTLTFVVKLDTLKTGIDLRDRHMREKYLETAKYPTATLVVDKSKLVLPESGSQKGETKGKLTLHGKTHEVPVTYNVQRVGEGYKVKAAFPTDYRDFGIEKPGYAGVTVQPKINVEVAFSAQDA